MNFDSLKCPINTNKFENYEIILGFIFIAPMYLFGILWMMNFGLKFLLAAGVNIDVGNNATVAWWNLIYYIFLLALLVCVFSSFLHREWSQFISNKKFCMQGWFTWFFVALGGNLAGSVAVLLLLPQQLNPNQEAINSAVKTAALPMILATIIIGPICEEIIFRGFIFRCLRKHSWIIAHIVSAALFAFNHLWQDIISGNWSLLLMTIPYFLMGIALSSAYESKRNLAIPISIHMAVNLIATISQFI